MAVMVQGAIRGDAWYIASRYCSGALQMLLLAADSMVIEESPQCGAARRDPAILARRHDLVQRQVSGCRGIRARSDSAWESSGEALPPKSFAATLPVASKRCAPGVGLRR